MRLVQLSDPGFRRRLAVVDGPRLLLVSGYDSVYSLALLAIERGDTLADMAAWLVSSETVPYDPVYEGVSDWSLLPAFDHPESPALCLVSGTGLTHLRSAQTRDSMHQDSASDTPTDSLRMYNLGLEGGRPAEGRIGAQPEWFYKGTGAVLRAHGTELDTPVFALDGGEEAEIAGCYVVDYSGRPWRVGLAQGNEFSDHVLERQNYLYLAHSKLRSCAIGPELVLNATFEDVRGTARVVRNGQAVWEKELASGERNMCHSLANLEHHHFKYEQHRRPGEAHVHFFGAGVFSFSSGLRLEDEDVMEVGFSGYGRPLRNPIRVEARESGPVTVRSL